MSNIAEKNILQLPLSFKAKTEAKKPTTLFKIRETVVRYRTLAKVKELVKEPEHVAALFRRIVPNNIQEHLCLFCLDGSHTVTHGSVLFTGTANMAMAHPREIFQVAIVSGACAIVIAHNHPSGSLTPSSEDKRTTKRINEAGELLGIKLLDHVIVTDTEFNSAAQSGWI
jgi:DNA repair protein RadC